MYKKIQNRQAELTDFNQPLGFKINPLNRWVIKASTIPWDAIEERYASLFPSHTGPAAKPLRKALGYWGQTPLRPMLGPHMNSLLIKSQVEIQEIIQIDFGYNK
jgi:hypothetical protein